MTGLIEPTSDGDSEYGEEPEVTVIEIDSDQDE